MYTVSHANNMLSELLNGDFLGMYKVNYGLEVCGHFTTICYELPIYIIFIIWNIPTWIAQNFFNIDITSNFLSCSSNLYFMFLISLKTCPLDSINLINCIFRSFCSCYKKNM